jgi:hypothetical protein
MALPHATIQETFAGGDHHVVGGAAGTAMAALIPFHAIANQWPWTGEDVTNLLTVLLPALVWSAIAIVLLWRKMTVGPLFVLANVAVFVVFVPAPIAIDYGSLGRASIGVLLAALLTLPQATAVLQEQMRLVRSTFVLWSLPFWVVLAILLGALGPKYVW